MQLSEDVTEGVAVVDAIDCEDSFSVDSLTEAQQIRLTHALDEYLKSLEQGTSFDVDEFCRDEPLLRRALTLYLGKLNALYGLAGDRGQEGFGIPKTLGAFTLQREIGRGGMGIVYEATQAGMQRRVALKLLPLAATLDERQIARFKNESRAAGALEHPNIVPVYSVGEAEGIHYYAMQLIDGESVDHGIQRQKQPDVSGQQDGWKNNDWQTIVSWAIDAAEALHAAHETGVVHRDVKPSNLMVDRAGKIWVTDFGLARSQTNASLTQSGDVIGTMRYMSPEQACGRSAWVDGRSDIYSLAVTFYEMLTLHLAYPGDDGPSILQAIDQNDVIPLRQYCHHIPTDLETVIAKAMAKSRDDRYETSQAFADDLRRVMVGQPTVARPPTLVDQITRFSAQHKRGALLTVLLCALGFVGFAISTALIAAEKQRSDHHKFRALRNERLLRHTVDELGSKIAEELAAVPSAEPVRRRLLRQTIAYYETFAETAMDDPGLRRDLAVTYGKIGTLQDELRSSNQAIEALRHSEGLYGELAGEQPVNAQTQLDWSVSQNNLAESLHRAGQLEEAAAYFARAITTQEKLATAYPTPTYRVQLSTTLNNLGLLLSSSGANKEAEAAYLRSVDLLKTSEAATPDPKQQQQLAAVLSNLSALLAKDDPTRAIEHAREALANQTAALESEPGDAKLATQVITTLQTLGVSHSTNGDLTAAIDSFGKSVEVGRQLLARWPEQPQYRRDHVISQNHLGLALSKTGQLELALTAFDDALEHQRSLANDYPNDAETQSMLGGVLNNLGFLHQTLGQRNAAADSYDEAVKCQSRAAALAPQVDRYQSYLEKHRYNLGQLEAQR